MNKQERQRALRRLMREREWSSNWVGDLLGVHEVTVRNWARGKFAIPKRQLAKLESINAQPM